MVGIHGHHHNILAELVYRSVSQFLAEADADIVFLASIHIKHLCLLAYDVLFLEKFLPFPLLDERFSDTFHSIHAVIAELLAVVGVEIVITVVPQKGVGADSNPIAVIRIVFYGSVRGVMEVAEGNLAVLCDCLMDAVGLRNHIFVGIADAIGNIGLTVQGGNCIFSRKAFDFVGDLARFFFCDELGGLNTILEPCRTYDSVLGFRCHL